MPHGLHSNRDAFEENTHTHTRQINALSLLSTDTDGFLYVLFINLFYITQYKNCKFLSSLKRTLTQSVKTFLVFFLCFIVFYT